MITSSPGARLAEIDGRPLLFSAERQLLFEAQAVVVRLWPDLQKGLPAGAFVHEASSDGADGARILEDLMEAGLVEPIAPRSGSAEIVSSFRLRFDRFSVGLHATGPRIAAVIREMWGHLEAPWARCDEHLVVAEEGGRLGLAQPGEALEWFDWAEAGPATKIALTDIVLDALDDLVLHVATLAVSEEALLLCGAPGDGKSTLAVALDADPAFRLEGDDLASLTPEGRVRAIPFPATLKSGAWPILESARPDIPALAPYRRPDGQDVRYLPLAHAIDPQPLRVGCVLCLDRSPEAAPSLTPMTVDAAIEALLSGGWSQDRRLSPEGFDAIVACVGTARFYRMKYSRLDEALGMARRACQIASDISARAG